MNKMFHFIFLVLILITTFHLTAYADAANINKDIRIFSHQAKQIVREHFDELYPGVPEAEKRNIIMILTILN